MPEIVKEDLFLLNDFPFSLYELYPENSDVPNYHFHDYFEINYIKSGHGLYYIKDKKYFILPGDIFIINSSDPHFAWSAGDLNILALVFPSSFIWGGNQDLYNNEYLKPFYISSQGAFNKISYDDDIAIKTVEIIKEIENEYYTKEKGYKPMIKALLLQLLSYFIRYYRKNNINANIELHKENYEKIKKALDHMQNNYNHPIHVEQLSKICNLSKSHFCYIFKTTMGLTPLDYLTKLRIQKALELLGNSNLSVTEIAYEVGFNSVTSFNISFKKWTGITPTECRK
ncbi:AraC family transcriptional regulator [Caldicellulosiruptoraceae bacterium PP1]